MDISFHYYAVKTIASKAGFSEEDAQTIAQYSQYIDDYNPIFSRKYSNIPDWLIHKPGSDIYIADKFRLFNFRPVTTGFKAIDALDMLTKRFQRNVISPFHFIPFDTERIKKGDNTAHPLKITNGGDGSEISEQLSKAKNHYQKLIGAEGKDNDAVRRSLMHIGMLLHTFADTYAHQTFSGYNEKCNDKKIVQVIHNATRADITAAVSSDIKEAREEYLVGAKETGKILEIGHMLAGHVPDWTHITFKMEYHDYIDNEKKIYCRNNTECFTDAGLEVFDFLCECRNETPAEDKRNQLSQKLYKAFAAADISKLGLDTRARADKLNKTWSGVFPECSYEYDKLSIFDGIAGKLFSAENEFEDENNLGKTMSEDFYYFNSFAEDLLIALYGNHPRKE